MMNQKYLLTSKLRFLGASHTIARDRLKVLFDKIPKHRLITIIAGAGYGKSTLAAQAVEYLKIPTVWFRMDEHDQDLAAFWSYLLGGLRHHFPDIGDDILSIIHEGRIDQTVSESMVRMLIGALQHKVTTDIIIVFDDFHTVTDSPEINNCLLDFMQNMPCFVHVMIISRTEPSWPLSLARSRREVLDIRETDLNFTASEVGRLYAEIFQFSPDNTIINIIHQKTFGWVSGVILFYHTLQGKKPSEIRKLVYKLNGSHDIIAAYLEENVYQKQSKKMKTFLLQTSLLERLDVALCQELNKGCTVVDMLEELEKQHLFTFFVDATRREYHFHQLFRDFLTTKLKQELSPEDIFALHHKIAALFEKRGHLREAFDHYIHAHRWTSACRLFRDEGRQMLVLGHLQTFKSYLKKIPPRYTRPEPMLYYLNAQAKLLEYGRPTAAKHFKTALKKSEKSNDIQVKHLCLKELAIEQAEIGNYQEARQQFLNLLDIPSKEIVLKYRLEIHLVIITNLLKSQCILGLFEETNQFLNLLRKTADMLQEEGHPEYFNTGFTIYECLMQCLVQIHRGNNINTLNLLDEISNTVNNFNNIHIHGLYFCLKAHAAVNVSDYGTAVKASMTGLERQKMFGAGNGIMAWLNYLTGRGYLGLRRWDKAFDHFEAALELFKEANNYHGQAESYLGLYYMAFGTGRISKAYDYLQQSHQAIQKCSVPAIEGAVLGQLALFKLYQTDFDSAAALLKKGKLATGNFPVQQTVLLCLRAYYYRRQGRKSFAINSLREHLSILSEHFENHKDVTWQFIPMISLLVEAYAKGVMKPFLERIFKQLGPTAGEELSRLAKDTKPLVHHAATALLYQTAKDEAPILEACFFKCFTLKIGDKTISENHWKNRKALLLLKYLLISRKRGFLPKDALMEFLWPDEDPIKTSNRFHVSLNALRKVLEPDLPPKSMSSYLERQGENYRIAPSKIKTLDIERFEDEIKMGRDHKKPDEAIIHYNNAERLYEGDLLENEPYAEWCLDLKHYYRQKYFDLIPLILDYYERKEELQTCIRYAYKFLERDRFNEDVYQRLMKYYYFMGDQAKLTAIFNQCQQILIEELDSPLSAKTVTIFKSYQQ